MTSWRKADHYVRQGRAKWVNPTRIEFIEHDYRHLAAMEAPRRWVDGGLATLEQVRGLPVVVDPLSLLVNRRSDRGFHATPAYAAFIKALRRRIKAKRKREEELAS